MQHPSCAGIRIRSTRDAHIIFHAVSLGVLTMITRRLDADERLALRSGCVYAWEERGPHTEVTGLGIERFTEGRRWGPSRVRDEFLFYYEKSPPPNHKDKENPDWDHHAHKHWDPLVKQTYSVWVDSPRGRRKWHLTAYFTQATVDQLNTIDDIPQLRGLEVPPGKYQSTRIGKARRPDEPRITASHDVFRPANASATRTYAAFPLPYSEPNAQYHPIQHGGHYSPPHDVRHTYSLAPGQRYDPPQQYHGSGSAPAMPLPPPQHTLTLPPLRAPPSPDLPPLFDYRYQSDYHPSREYPPPDANNSGGALQPYPHPGSSHDPSSSYALRPAYYPQPVPAPYPTYHPIAQSSTQTSPQNSYHTSPPHPPRYSAYPSSSESRYSPYLSAHPRHEHPTPSDVTSSRTSPHSRRVESPTYDGRSPSPSATRDSTRTSPSPRPSPTPASGRRSPLTLPSLPSLSPPKLLPSLSAPVSDARDESLPSSPGSSKSSSRGVGLAPLRALQRPHPYRRENFDDQALKAFCSRR